MSEVRERVRDAYCINCNNIDSCFVCEIKDGEPTQYQSKLNSNPIKAKGKYEQIGTEIGKLVDEKNKAYGDSVNTSAEAFKLLYPNGIKPEQYSDALLLVRTWDKMKRIATKKDAFGENPWQDINGYSLLGIMKDSGKC